MFSNILNLVGQKQNKIAEEDVDEEGEIDFVFLYRIPRE